MRSEEEHREIRRLVFLLLRYSTCDRGCPIPGCPPEWCVSDFQFSAGQICRSVLPGLASLRESFELPGGWCCGPRRNPLHRERRGRRSQRGRLCWLCRG